MLLILILLAWLAAVTLLVAVCRAAASGESSRTHDDGERPQVIREGLVVWDEETAARLRGARPLSTRPRGGRGSGHERTRVPGRGRQAPGTRARGVAAQGRR